MKTLHEKIADRLKWKVDEVASFSLAALRDLVKPLDSNLASEVSDALHCRAHLFTPQTTFACNSDLTRRRLVEHYRKANAQSST